MISVAANIRTSFAVEFEKLRRRPASWVLLGILTAFIILIRYAAGYALVTSSPMGGSQMAEFVLPAGMPSAVLSVIPQVGAALAIVLGAMVMGSEYRWDTVKASVVRKPGRLGFVAGKILALCAAAATLALAALITGLVCSLVVAAILGTGLQTPPPAEAAAAFGAAWLIMAAYAALGLFFGVLVKGAGAAIALGLIYVLILESFISGVAGQLPGGQSVSAVLPGGAAGNLTSAIGQSGMTPPASGMLSSPTAALLILAAWVILLGAASILLFTRRDSP